MAVVDLHPTGASTSGTPAWTTRVLSVAIGLLLVAGVGAAAVRSGGDSPAGATAEDLALIQASSGAVEALEAIEMSMRFTINGHTTTLEGSGNATDGRFTTSIPGFAAFEVIQVGNRTYLPAFQQPGWSEFIGPTGTATEAASVIAGQDPLDHLGAVSSTHEIEILGRGSVDGVDVTRYRTEIALVDALRAAEANIGNLGVPEAEVERMLADASPMRVDVEIDDAGIPRRTIVTYEIQGIDFELESRIRPVDAVDPVSAPPAGEIVSSHPADDLVQLQQLIAAHIAQYAGG